MELTKKQQTHQKAAELHSQYAALVKRAADEAAPALLSQKPPDNEKELSARRWANLRVALLDSGFSYSEAVVLAKALAALVPQGLWPHDQEAVLALCADALVGQPPREDASEYGLMVLVRKYAARLAGSPYDSHEFAVLSVSKRLRKFIAQCEATGIARELVANDIATSAELTPEMVYRVETAGKRITAPMLLRLDRALRRAEMEAANG